MYQVFLVQIAFESSKKIKFSSQGTYNFQILGNETLIIADCEYKKIFRLALLGIKL